ncbi:hypothetical protein [Nostoc sp.]
MWGDRTEVSEHLQRAYTLSIEYINFLTVAIATKFNSEPLLK